MWNLGNRVVVGALTAIIFCVLLYKVWGPILALTLSLVVVVHTCYSLLVNDSIISPHSLLLAKYAKDAFHATEWIVENIVFYAIYLYDLLKQRLQNRVDSPSEMTQRRTGYRLSTDFIEQPSPIARGSNRLFALNGDCDGGRTSTPLVANGGSLSFAPLIHQHIKKTSPLRMDNRRSLPGGEETFFTPKTTSPWGTSISPKMRERAAGVKTVQTVAGPLLASTRYNIDPKTYTDVTSPGLTTRLTKYASEASNKLTHQSQYSTGQFPKVNLKAGPTPLMSPKVAKARAPVTVRIAPMDLAISPQNRKKTLFENVQTETWEPETNVTKVLKEISLKRHASREDVMSDLVKKQRTDRVLSEEELEIALEKFDEIFQKRARDDSTASEDELSQQSKPLRPTKRSKASSCNEITNSLSSSVHVLSGVKRKAMDTSRSSTPDIEKHFKPSSRPQSFDSSLNEPARSRQDLNIKTPTSMSEPHKILGEESSLTKKSNSPEILPRFTEKSTEENDLQLPKSGKCTNLADKLFMRAEPQNNEKLKTLIKEQANVEAKFSADDKDEIKKKDIVNMRQTSMRTRLQSMFDAISGKSANKIDPGVVIQAEEVNPPTSTAASLTSLTSTTNINTSPITSSSIIPILKTDTISKSPTLKHVTFNLPSTPSVSVSDGLTKPVTSVTSSPPSNFGTLATSVTPSTFKLGTSTISTSTPNFSFASNPTTTTGFTLPNAPPKINGIDLPKSDASSALVSSCQPTLTSLSTGFSFGSSTATASTLNSTFTVSPVSSATAVSTTAQNTVSAPSLFSDAKIGTTTSTTSLPTFGSITTKPGFSFGNSAPVESLFSTSATTATTTTTAQSSFFSSAATSASGTLPIPSFTANLNTPVSTSTATPAATTASTGFSFGASSLATSKPGFSFAATTTSTSLPSMSTFTSSNASTLFSAPTTQMPTLSTQSQASSVFAPKSTGASTFGSATPALFGSSASLFATTTTTTASAPVTSSMTFGAANTTSTLGALNSNTLTFGATNTSTSSFAAPSNTATAFGATNSTTSSFAAPSNTAPAFGATNTSTSTFAAPSNTAPAFGATSTSTSTFAAPSSTAPAFGSTNRSAPTFGASSTASTPNLFGSVAVSTATSLPAFGSTPSNLFSTPAPASTTTSSMGAFGAPAPSLFSTPAASTPESSSIFGQAKPQPSLSFGGSNSTFGNTTSPTIFGSQPASTSVFGATNGAQSSSLPTMNATKPTFAAPTFGSTVPNTTPTPSAFGMSNSTPSFEAAATPSPFGQTASTFGGTPMNNNNASAGSTFAFGASQQPQQPTTGFSFSGAPAASAPSATPFQFGATSAAKPAGFNFSGTPAAPTMNFGATSGTAFSAPATLAPGFAAPASNMFSIGTGSTAPRPRNSRPRKQR